METPTHTVTIVCPECRREQLATVKEAEPFNIYVHTCINCNYVIMESEWDEVTDKL